MNARMSINAIFSLLKERVKSDIDIPNLHELSDFGMKLTNATLCISLINIISEKVEEAIKEINEFASQVQNFEAQKHGDFVKEIKQTADSLTKMNKSLNSNLVDKETISKLQTALRDFRMKVDDYKEQIKDKNLLLSLYKLLVTLDMTLMEQIPTEERSEHLLACHHAYRDTALLLEDVQQYLSDPNVAELALHVSVLITKSYREIYATRQPLNTAPSDYDTLVDLSKALKQTSEFIDTLMLFSEQVKGKANSEALQRQITRFERSLKVSRELLTQTEALETNPRSSIKTQIARVLVLIKDLNKRFHELYLSEELHFFKKIQKAME